MKTLESILKKLNISGYRGIIGEEINPEIIFDLVNCYLEFFNPRSLAVGMDTRPTSIYYKDLIKSLAISKEIDLYDFGIIPTPSLLFAVKELGLDSGIMITASHNPIEYNALKLIKKGGFFLFEEDIEGFKKNILDKDTQIIERGYSYSKYIGKCYNLDIIDKHIDKISNYVDFDLIKRSNLKVACDFCNGATIFSIPKLLDRLNVKFDSIFDDPKKAFERMPEPNQETMKYLSNFMKDKDYDLGFIYDPDGDRVVILLGDGKIISEEFMLLFAYISYLNKRSSDIVVNLSTSKMIEIIANEYGKKVYYTKVGEINVTKEMLNNNIKFGGEGNGGVIYFDISNSRDSLVATSLILELYAKNRELFYKIYDRFKDLVKLKKKFPKDNFNDERFERMIYNNFKDDLIDYSKIDGVRFNFKNGFLHLRESNTEPIIRVIIEGNKEFVDDLSNKIDYYFS